MKTLVVIPTYNEKDNIERAVAGVRHFAPHVDILIADDNSPDGTGDIADRLAVDPHVQVLHREHKEGLGAAYVHGFGWALDRGYEVIVEMDADGSHRPQDLPHLLNAVQAYPDAALVLGSRWVPGGAVRNWPASRMLLSRGGNLYTRLMLGTHVRDATGGFRAFRAQTLRALELSSVRSQGYCFQVDLVRRVHAAGLCIVEVPIIFVEREFGTSKMSGHIVREALWRVTLWGISDRLSRLARLAIKRNDAAHSLLSEPQQDVR